MHEARENSHKCQPGRYNLKSFVTLEHNTLGNANWSVSEKPYFTLTVNSNRVKYRLVWERLNIGWSVGKAIHWPGVVAEASYCLLDLGVLGINNLLSALLVCRTSSISLSSKLFFVVGPINRATRTTHRAT